MTREKYTPKQKEGERERDGQAGPRPAQPRRSNGARREDGGMLGGECSAAPAGSSAARRRGEVPGAIAIALLAARLKRDREGDDSVNGKARDPFQRLGREAETG